MVSGWKEATFLGIGAMVGAGIFVLSGVAASKAGPAVIVCFFLAATLAMLLGSCYAELPHVILVLKELMNI
ncbi:amino acid permease [Alkaliphilus metalliredigens]|uniref:amino acid permease n=1 Tax=Alkaliphilus metalliredigens TaxID=208226 RepID=UPI00005CCFDC|nr:amino acid permease [Alkaliphilus metalliredigens]